MNLPIVMSAVGTTARALETYEYIDKICKERFPDYPFHWAFSSRMIKSGALKRTEVELKSPNQILAELKVKGHRRAVVQPLYILCGHEYYRLIEKIRTWGIKTSIGVPLLYRVEDYVLTAEALRPMLYHQEDEAVILVGHGTDHPIWPAYGFLKTILQEKFGPEIYVGVLEGFPPRSKIVDEVNKAGFKSVRIIPFMLVAGFHFQKDLAGDEDSWKKAFEEKNISVSFETKGIGFNKDIINIFCKHIQEALGVIPTEKSLSFH